MDELQKFVPNVHFEQIPIKNLVSNQEYQRNLSPSHVQRAAENFDLFQINPVKVSRRDGINYVFNGQHTIEIVALVSGSRDTPVWCMIYDDMDYQQEADIFANQMKYVKPLAPYEIFMANIEAGNDKQIIIRDLLESYGLKVSHNKVPGGVCAITTVETIYDTHGFHILDRVLQLAIGTWEGDMNSFGGNILNGIARILVTYGAQIKDDIFIEKVGRYSIKEITRTAKERRAGSLGFSETMMLIYNKKLHNPLPLSAMYTKKRASHEIIAEALEQVARAAADEMDDSEDDEDSVNLFDDPM